MPDRAALILGVAAALLLAATLPCAQAAAPLVQSGPLSFAPLARHVIPAVVNIAVLVDGPADVPAELRGTPFEKRYRQHEQAQGKRAVGAGSGFIIDPAGLIVTNDHVVGDASQIVVSLADGTELPARLVGVDELTDIAVIRVSPRHALPSVPWGDSRGVQVGDWILAAGNPFGLASSVTAGIVSARGRELGGGPFDDFFQLDAPINPGNSGGPTFDMSGEVIGINSAIVSPTGGSVGIGFAIPSEIARPIVEALIAHGHIERGWLGITLLPAAGGTAAPGAMVATVAGAGPAYRAGVRPGDRIVAVNNEAVVQARDLIRDVAAITPGRPARLRVRRRAQVIEVTVAVGKRPVSP